MPPPGARGLSRRDLLLLSGPLYGGGLWLLLSLPRPLASAAAEASAQPLVLDAAEWRALDAIAARIVPTDHEPGAREAGCVNFIDKALAHEDAPALPLYRSGLAGIDAAARAAQRAPFAELTASAQDALLAALERGEAAGWPAGAVAQPVFFETLRAHVLIGFLCDPRHGGNRGYAGWRVTGYPGPRHHAGGYTPAEMLGEAKIRAVWGDEL
jgi:gluconate 2-dehydrogenase gamma chain